MPFLFIAAMIRMIDAVKSVDIIVAITQGGPGSASETINRYLYSGRPLFITTSATPSAIVVGFFALIVALAGALLRIAGKEPHWNDAGGVEAEPASANWQRDRRLGFAASLVIVSPACCFFSGCCAVAQISRSNNASYPPVFIPERSTWGNYAAVIDSKRFQPFVMQQPDRDGGRNRFALLVASARRLCVLARMRATNPRSDPDRAASPPGLSLVSFRCF